ncbi:tetratricopeptide repeat protein [Bradyrhizobium sp.]|jgi:predicted Zn-dependent protease|uniref:tetratricopeptide repeat protein n=1 Tax=Bradyrhizobium sp. TaxID=376 RepID=UPI003BB0D916
MSKRPPSNLERPSPNNPALDKAILAFRMQRLDEAERLASDVLKSNRGNVVAADVLGRALLMQNRPKEAVDPLQRAARRSHDPAIEVLLAAALAAAGRNDVALDQLRRTTARRPPFPPAFIELGSQFGKLGRFDEGIAVLESGLALTPGVLDLLMGLGHLHLKRNDRAEARASFSQVLATAPQRHDALVALAKAMALDGEYAAAADLYRRALALQPDDAAIRVNLGKCLLEMGERDAGEATLRAATRGSAQLAGPAIVALAAAPHGRFFLRPSAAAKFLRVEKN